jgi:hypothetical protein
MNLSRPHFRHAIVLAIVLLMMTAAALARTTMTKAVAAPMVNAVPASTTNNPLLVTGTAPAGAEVRLFVNGQLMELGTADAGGAFSIKAPLFDGGNDIYAVAASGLEQSTPSNAVSTVYTNNLPRSQSGIVNTDTVWTPAGGAYVLAGNLTIAAGVQLRLMPGVEIRAAGNYEIQVAGLLVGSGTSAAGIAFKSGLANPTKTSWKGLKITDTGFVDLDYVTIEHATKGLFFSGGEGQVLHSTIRNNTDGVYIAANSSPVFDQGCLVTNNGRGIVVSGNSIAANNPAPVFRNGSIYGNPWNVHATAFGTPANAVLDFTGNWWGSADPTTIESNVFHRKDASTSPLVNYVEFLDGVGGQQVLVAFDVNFIARTVDALTGASSRTDFAVNTASHVLVDVVREDSGAIVRTVDFGQLPAGIASFAWDGKDDAGIHVEEGLYRFVPRLEKNGAFWTQDPPTQGEGTGTGAIPARFNAHRNEFWKMSYSVSPGYSQNGGSIEMQVTPSGGPMFKPFAKRYWSGSPEWVYWDGRDPQGNLVLGTVDIYFPPPGFLRPWHLRVLENAPRITGTQVAPLVEVKSDPYLITHSYEQLSRIAFRVSLDSTVTVKLLPPGIVDPASPQSIALMQSQLLQAKDGSGAPIDHVIEWRGNESADVNRMRTAEEGAYTFAIEAQSTQTGRSTLYRGVLQIYQ